MNIDHARLQALVEELGDAWLILEMAEKKQAEAEILCCPDHYLVYLQHVNEPKTLYFGSHIAQP